MDLVVSTGRYQRHQVAHGLAVRSSVGAPRFRLGYPLAGYAALTAPTWRMLRLDREAYTAAYLDRLERVGVDKIGVQLATIAAGWDRAAGPARLVLLCYEDLSNPGNWCHRTIFASWWHDRTGSEVRELAEQPDPSLF